MKKIYFLSMLSIVSIFCNAQIISAVNYDSNGVEYKRSMAPVPNRYGSYKVKDEYSNGKTRLTTITIYKAELIPDGEYIEFFANGNKKCVFEYDKGTQVGDATEYYPNGNIALKKIYDKAGGIYMKECRDTNNVILTKSGKGKWIEYDSKYKKVIKQGWVEDGKEVGGWNGNIGDSINYSYNYENSILVNGVSKSYNGSVYKFSKIETKPEVADGMPALVNAIKYPELAKKYNVQGSVLIRIVIEKNGQLSEVNDIRGIGSGCDEAVINALKSFPIWKPATKYGVPLKKSIALSIAFTLEKTGDKLILENY